MDIELLYKHFLNSSGISTDTRQIQRNSLFFALKGENFNGNKFTQEALDKGASKVIIDDPEYQKPHGQTILVHNSLLALQQLATFHRKQLNIPIIALTGSNGKTTSKELINAVLSKKFKTVATKGNLNNHIGVPLTLLSITPETEMAILEMGANHAGEIKLLSEIAQPDFGYITNFGKAHLEGFGSVEGVIKAKTELYQYLKNNKKTVFVNADDEKQVENAKEINKITFGKEGNDFNISLLGSSGLLSVAFEDVKIQSNLVGLYNFANLSAAIAIGSYFKVSKEAIKYGIETYLPQNNRSQMLKKNTNTVLLDAYNANPTSMMAALENFKQTDGENKILYLGDMFELGNEAAAEHQNIVDFLSDNNFEKVYLVGSNFYKTDASSPKINKFETFDDFKKEIEQNPPTNSNILIKASRGMALERILDILK